MKTKMLMPLLLVAVVLSFVIGRLTGGDPGVPKPATDSAQAAEFWTCSMHPQIRQPGPGKCPICAMDLVPVFGSAPSGVAAEELHLSPTAVELAGIQTTPVRRAMPTVEVRMVGKIDHDETRLSYITTRFPGRLDRLFVDYTGLQVNEGDHLAEIYSPELLAAQEELLQAIRTQRELSESSSNLLRERASETVRSAREKLLLWGLTQDQIETIESGGSPSDRLTIFAPMGGVVIRKEAVEGKYVQTGAPLYTISDLSHVWVKLDAYETDLVWLHFGQEVHFTSEAYPGEKFVGRIAFIDPVLNPSTRTARVRVNMENPGGRLKPEMFVNATVRSQIATDGKVMSPELAGKWISPMHPEIVSDEPGPCPVCGMDLVSAESLGYLPANVDEAELPLVIPATAPLITGKRAVVYVADAERPGVFEGREVVLGPRAGDQYIVKSGLQSGELVVSNGAFKIDSAVQILARPSMMNPREPEALEVHEAPETFRLDLADVVNAYLPIATALSRDDLEGTKSSVATFSEAVSNVATGLLSGDAHSAWMKHLETLNTAADAMRDASSIADARAAFDDASKALIDSSRMFGLSAGSRFRVFHCPMAFEDRGADWIQTKPETENPFFGAEMFRCGSETGDLSWRGEALAPTAPAGSAEHVH